MRYFLISRNFTPQNTNIYLIQESNPNIHTTVLWYPWLIQLNNFTYILTRYKGGFLCRKPHLSIHSHHALSLQIL